MTIMSSSSTSTSSPAIAADRSIGDIVAARPLLAKLFENLGIDYCCGGKVTLNDACIRRGLSVETVIAMLNATESAFTSGGPAINAAEMTLTQLADHIEATHHRYTKEELPRLVDMAGRCATKHAWRDPRLTEVESTVFALAQEMFSHMQKEETILFPLVRRIDRDAGYPRSNLANPIRQMESEHEHAGAALVRLRELTDNFTPDADACNTHRALLASLAAFELDLHQHVHKENNIMFPRALS